MTKTGTARTDLLRFRVRPDERAEIQLHALRAHAPVSEYLRVAAMEYGRRSAAHVGVRESAKAT